MALFLILALTVLLYIRTLNYNYVIDDIVKRDGYLYVVPDSAPSPDFWKKKPSPWYRAFMILTHCVNITAIYALWGWCPALLFAVHPIGIVGTAWVTGNYYATTTLFCLASFYFLHIFPNILGASLSVAFMTAALNSTVGALAFPFLLSIAFFPWGLTNLLPLVMFLRGKRWRAGLKKRVQLKSGGIVDLPKWEFRRIFLMTKVMARYIYLAFYPNKLGFFRIFGQGISAYRERYDHMHAPNGEFLGSALLCATVLGVGLIINPVATAWFFILMGLHTQWQLMGQFFAERYLYMPLIGLCVIVGSLIQSSPVLVAVVTTALVYRTIQQIPAWRNQEELWKSDVANFPEYYSVYNNLAQYYMSTGKVDVNHVNQIAAYLRKAENIAPNAWEVHMNISCFNHLIGQYDLCLQYTRSAIECKKKVCKEGFVDLPLEKLLEQEKQIVDYIKKKKGELGESLSHPKKEEENGTRKEEGENAGVAEHDRERNLALSKA